MSFNLKSGHIEGSEASPRERILTAAESALAEQGLEGASLRTITAAAGVNIAAVNYYFGTKEQLVYAVLDQLACRINQRRISQLNSAFQEAQAAGAKPSIEKVLDIFIAPYVRPETRQEGDLLMKLILLHRSAPNDITREIISKHFNPLSRRFIEALEELLPDKRRVDLAWRYFFMVGAVLFGISETGSGGRIATVSDGSASPQDQAELINQLKRFLIAGLTASNVEVD